MFVSNRYIKVITEFLKSVYSHSIVPQKRLTKKTVISMGLSQL